jgi:excinuclease UvrABC helicase subunit UvrB
MRKAAKNLEFEKAALLRDRIIELRKDEEILSPLTKSK